MNNNNNKKISTSLLLISVSLIILLTLIKQDVRRYYKPVQIYKLFGEEYSYNNSLFALFVIIIASILLFVYTDDNKLKVVWMSFVDVLKKRYNKQWLEDKKNYVNSSLQNFTPKNFIKSFKAFFKSMYEHHTIIDGRNGRLKFLGNQVLNSIISFIFFRAILSSIDNLEFEGKVILFVIAWVVTFILFHYRNWAKRFQDFGWNGKIALIGVIPYLGFIIIPFLLLVPGSEFPNKFGRQNV